MLAKLTKIIFKLLPVLAVFLFILFKLDVYAQKFPTLGGVAVNVELADSSAAAGDIVSVGDNGLVRSKTAYDDHVFGVVIAAPVISVQPKTPSTKSVISEGEAQVNVTAAGGAIAVGDFITSSDKAGIGQKATKSGYVIGKALAKYDDKSKNGQIPIALSVGFQVNGPLQGIGAAGGGVVTSLSGLVGGKLDFRYLLAAIVALLVFAASVFTFIRFVNTGLEAIGRNPLAKRTIIVGMFISGTIVVVLAVAGFGIAFAIINLGK